MACFLYKNIISKENRLQKGCDNTYIYILFIDIWTKDSYQQMLTLFGRMSLPCCKPTPSELLSVETYQFTQKLEMSKLQLFSEAGNSEIPPSNPQTVENTATIFSK